MLLYVTWVQLRSEKARRVAGIGVRGEVMKRSPSGDVVQYLQVEHIESAQCWVGRRKR